MFSFNLRSRGEVAGATLTLEEGQLKAELQKLEDASSRARDDVFRLDQEIGKKAFSTNVFRHCFFSPHSLMGFWMR